MKSKRDKREKSEEEKNGSGRPSARLTDRDLAALAWLVEQRAATLPQLTELLGQLGGRPITGRRGSQLVERWVNLGLVERHFVWHKEPAVIWPTSAGAKLTGAIRWRKPSIGTLRHTIATSAIRLRVCRPGSGRTWINEAGCRAMLPADTRIPDGAIVEPDGSMVAVETELSSHGRTRVFAAQLSLLSSRNGTEDMFKHVLYCCSETTIHQVKAVRAELPERLRERVVVVACPK